MGKAKKNKVKNPPTTASDDQTSSQSPSKPVVTNTSGKDGSGGSVSRSSSAKDLTATESNGHGKEDQNVVAKKESVDCKNHENGGGSQNEVEPERPKDGCPAEAGPLAERANTAEATPAPAAKKEGVSQQTELEELKKSLSEERDCGHLLRTQLSQLEEEAALREAQEAGTAKEIQRLREENGRLNGQVAGLKESVERLEGERKQLLGRLSALQAGMQQLEREAAIRARLQSDLADAVDQPKTWWGGGKDPFAEAAAMAEEARVQKAAAAATVDKLLSENAELTERLNEQSALIDRLAQRYSTLAGKVESSPRFPLAQPMPPAGTGAESTAVTRDASVGEGEQPSPSTTAAVADVERGEEGEATVAITAPAEQQMDKGSSEPSTSNQEEAQSLPNGALGGSGGPPASPLHRPVGPPPRPIRGGEIEEEIDDSYDAKNIPPRRQVLAPPKGPVPFSDSPIMGAPLRVVSFISRFVAGSDLVKK